MSFPRLLFAIVLAAGCATVEKAADVSEPPAPVEPPPLEIVRIARSPTALTRVATGDAGSVGASVGEEVVFEDTITSIEHRVDGVNLRFGPAEQSVLAVWIPKATFDRLPRKKLAMGRRVRIAGFVQHLSVHPQIDVATLEDVALLAVDETILEQRGIDGHQQRMWFDAALRQRISRAEAADVEALEKLGQELAASARANRDSILGRRYALLITFFEAFRSPHGAKGEAFDKRARLIADWRARHAQSALPILLEAMLHIDRSRCSCSRGYLRSVALSDLASAQRELAVARELLEHDPETRKWPYAYELLQEIALGQGWRRESYLWLFDEASTLEPDYLEYHLNAVTYLSPEWFGEKGDVEEFVTRQRELRRGTEGDILYAMVAWRIKSQRGRAWRLFEETSLSWSIVASGLSALIERSANPTYFRNVYARLAWEARDRERLRAALDAMGDEIDIDVWDDMTNLPVARQFASRSDRQPLTR